MYVRVDKCLHNEMNLFQHWQCGWWKDIPGYSPGSSSNTSIPTSGMDSTSPKSWGRWIWNSRAHQFVLSLWEMKGIVTKYHQHRGGKRRIPELSNLKSRLECVSPNLSSFLTPVPILLSCATTQQGLGGRAMEQERMCWPKSELQFKGTVPPSHVHTGFDSSHL